ncbi:acyl-CoA thioesterase [Novispirillum sp. DQ9]|uniref:acyl-CoA thioesterase n=1 Tax=Novispirillum sp. DQ9 TaxID=3398612 RepID=UPI003C7D5513
MPAFIRRKLIRFHHCDPAGIVFYPQYFILFNELVEDWFAEGLDLPFGELHVNQRLGTPTAHIECKFMGPSRVDDLLDFALAVTSIGTSSINLAVSVSKDFTERLVARQTLVLVSLDTMKSLPIPDDLRARLETFKP